MSAIILSTTGFVLRAETRETYNIADTLSKDVRLEEVVIKAKKQKYSKKNNPAVDFVNRLRNQSSQNDPKNSHDYYSYDRYGRITMALCPFDTTWAGKGNFSFLKDYAQVSPLSDRLILPFSVKEKASTVYWLNDGNTTKEVIEAVSRNGIDEITDMAGTERILEDVMREIDLYSNDIAVFQNRFVSPLSKIGPDFYMYFLTDTITAEDGSRWIELSFTPRVNTTFGFLGRLYVEEGDSTMFVRNVKMGLPHNINLNFVDKVNMEQTYERAPDGSRIKVMDDFQAELSIIPGTPGIYTRRLSLYDNHSFEEPDSTTLSFVKGIVGDTYQFDDAEEKGDVEDYWVAMREEEMTEAEQDIKGLMTQLRERRSYRYLERTIKILSTGYISTGYNRKSKFDIGPIFSFLSHDDLQGWRLMAGGMTTAAFSKRWFLSGDVAYGFKDHRWKGGGAVEYSFNEKKNHAKEFPVHSLKLSARDDVDYMSQKMTGYGMLFESWQRSGHSLINYSRSVNLTYTHERSNHFSWTLSGEIARKEATELSPFIRTDGLLLNHFYTYDAFTTLRWAPGEKFYETRNHRLPINYDNLTFSLSIGAGQLDTPWKNFNRLTVGLGISKRFWLSAFGTLDIDISGSKVFGVVPYPFLGSAPSSMSYIVVPGAFTLADPMEFVGDLYGQWEIIYKARGTIFNRIPLIKKLRMRELVGFRGWWGRLSDKNNPFKNWELFQFPYNGVNLDMPRPYMEIYVGLDNILRFLRIDYVWRLTYRDTPGCHKGGLRVGVHFSF